MKTRLISVVIGLFALLPFAVTSCLMNDSEDYPDFSEQLQKDLQIIDDYLTTNNINAEQDPDGFIRYVIHRDLGSSRKPTLDSCATVNYEGLLLSNGQEFDDATGFSFPVNGVINGWRVGIPLLKVGDSATFYIPSGLAYGFQGFSPDIPANANLVFHVGLTDIGDSYNGTSSSCQ